MTDIINIKDWKQLNEMLFSYDADTKTGRYRSNFVYRGVDDESFNLESSFYRLKKSATNIESHIIRNFIKYTKTELPNNYSIWDFLSIAQHHGLPTRLLDWSFSPYVALHFATSDLSKFDKDAAIWCINMVDVHKTLDPRYKNALEEEGSYVFTTEMMAKLDDKLLDFDSTSVGQRLCFFEPPSIDGRIINQFALFSIINNPNITINDWLVNNTTVLSQKIIIPSSIKWEVRDKLDQMNITERVLFPGIDGISTWLKRYYTDKSKT